MKPKLMLSIGCIVSLVAVNHLAAAPSPNLGASGGGLTLYVNQTPVNWGNYYQIELYLADYNVEGGGTGKIEDKACHAAKPASSSFAYASGIKEVGCKKEINGLIGGNIAKIKLVPLVIKGETFKAPGLELINPESLTLPWTASPKISCSGEIKLIKKGSGEYILDRANTQLPKQCYLNFIQ